jgi:ribosomal-protein-alanine N-acetyltransferase
MIETNERTSFMSADAGKGLSTARLSLRRYTMVDLPELHRLNSDAEVMRYLGGPTREADTRRMLETRILTYYDTHPGLGVWRTIERASGRCIGFHLLNHIQGESLIQVGYRLFREFWGQGYATEMSVALLRYGFAQLGLPTLTANAHPDNLGSQQVLLKSGLHRKGLRSFAHPAYAVFGDLAYFERDAGSWLAEFGATDSSH